MSNCPICGLELISQRLQFRQDDEPATLVVACPDHGAAADVVVKYRLKSTDSTVYDTSIRSDKMISQPPILYGDYTQSNIVTTWTCMRLDVICDNKMDFETQRYGVYNSSIIQSELSVQCTVRFDDPIWCIHSPVVTSNVESLSTVEDHCRYYRATIYATNECGKEGSFNSYSMEHKQLYDIQYKTRVVVVKLGQQNRYRLWFQIPDDLLEDNIRNLTLCASKILTVGCVKGSRILYKNSVQSWITSVLRYSVRDNIIPIHLNRDMMSEYSRGSFISAKGNFCYIYSNSWWILVLDRKDRTLVPVYVTSEYTEVKHPVVMSAYKHKSQYYIGTSLFVYPVISIDDISVDLLVEEIGVFARAQMEYSTNWRVFRPHGQSTIEFISCKDKPVSDIASYVTDYIALRTLESICTDTKAPIVFILGRPREPYMRYRRNIRICWVYEYAWDDVYDMDSYGSLADAYDNCGAKSHSICYPNFESLTESMSDSLYYILEDLEDAAIPTDSKFILYTTINGKFDKHVLSNCPKYCTVNINDKHGMISQICGSIGAKALTDHYMLCSESLECYIFASFLTVI